MDDYEDQNEKPFKAFIEVPEDQFDDAVQVFLNGLFFHVNWISRTGELYDLCIEHGLSIPMCKSKGVKFLTGLLDYAFEGKQSIQAGWNDITREKRDYYHNGETSVEWHYLANFNLELCQKSISALGSDREESSNETRRITYIDIKNIR